MEDHTDFELSRIYAGGWIAGRKSKGKDVADLAALMERLNPHSSLDERDLWRQGFKDSLVNGQKDPGALRRDR